MDEQVASLLAQLAEADERWPQAGVQAPDGSALGAHALARADTHAAFAELFAGQERQVRKWPCKDLELLA